MNRSADRFVFYNRYSIIGTRLSFFVIRLEQIRLPMKTRHAIALVLTVIVVGFYATSTNPDSQAGRQKNVKYMRNILGEIVIEYSQNHGRIPEGFEIALNDSNKTLPNRGDYYGRSMIYEKLSEDSFRFVAFGKNGEYDDGKSDDVVAQYADRAWTNNVEQTR